MKPPVDPDFIDKSCFKPSFRPYQGKVIYDIVKDESDYFSSDENNEDALFEEE